MFGSKIWMCLKSHIDKYLFSKIKLIELGSPKMVFETGGLMFSEPLPINNVQQYWMLSIYR